MKGLTSVFAAFVLFAGIALAAPQGPDVRVVDGKLTVNANSVPLSLLLQQFDAATGMNSRAPAELANRPVSVQFADLPIDAAITKIFQGQMLDYIYVGGRGIVVTAVSQTTPLPNTVATPFPREAPAPDQAGFAPGFAPDQPFPVDPNDSPAVNQGFINQGAPGSAGPGGQPQPAMIQTPFGPIPNPRLNQGNSNVPQTGTPPAGTVINPFGNPFGGAVPAGQQPTVLQPPTAAPNPFGNPTASSPGTTIAPITTAPLVPNQQAPAK